MNYSSSKCHKITFAIAMDQHASVTSADGETNICQEVVVVYLKKWVLSQNSKSFSILFIKPFLDNGLTEHELDHVMIGIMIDAPNINREEVGRLKWMKIEDVKSIWKRIRFCIFGSKLFSRQSFIIF
jgi:isopentenyldiphosphate isomerase